MERKYHSKILDFRLKIGDWGRHRAWGNTVVSWQLAAGRGKSEDRGEKAGW
jgi:hypothetical protein